MCPTISLSEAESRIFSLHHEPRIAGLQPNVLMQDLLMLLHMLLIMLFTIPVALRELAVTDVTRLLID